ncbi:MAG: hypothetical protein JXA57_17790 [Armatimonadetes bacterium]|nr:hypothetical protein [Armatimonadota bacterium]
MSDDRISLSEMDRIFGPGWRHPYCNWPRGSVREKPQETVARANPAVYPEAPSQQLRLGEEAAA